MNTGSQEPPPLGEAQDSQRQAVLIIENEKLVAWDIEQMLREAGYTEIITSTSVRDSRTLLQTHATRLQFSLLDLKLDDGDASDLINEMKTLDVPVLVVTGYSGLDVEKVPVLNKPFTSVGLMHAINSLLNNRS
jgi:DNA-binding NtrC family response regulator